MITISITPEYEYYREWLGGESDPEEFDVDKVNGLFERT